MQVTGVACAEQVTLHIMYFQLTKYVPQKVFRIFDSGFDTYADVFQNMQE